MPIKMLRLAEVEARTGLRKSQIYRLIAEGTFPKSVAISTRARRWPEHEIDAWLQARMRERESAPSGYGASRAAAAG